MSKFRGINWNNARFGPKIQVRRSIDIAELGDFGSITDERSDLPTRGSLHRTWTDSAETPIHGSKSGSREYTDLRYIDSNVVDTQDMGLIGETASTFRVWSSTGAITDISTSAPTTLGNPSSSSSSTSSTTYTWDSLSNLGTATTGIDSLTATGNGSYPHLKFYDGGTKLVFLSYNGGGNGGTQTWFDLSTAYDTSSMTKSTHYASGSNEPFLKYLSPDGSTGYSFDFYEGTQRYLRIKSWSLSTDWDLSSYGTTAASSLDIQILTSGNFYDITAIEFYNSGSSMLLMDRYGSTVILDLSTAYDPTTASLNSENYIAYNSGHALAAGSFNYTSFTWSDDGLTLFGYYSTRVLKKWTASTAWDIDTLTLDGSVNTPAGNIDIFALELDHENGRLYYTNGQLNYWPLSVTESTTSSSTSSSSTTSTATYSGPALSADYALDFSSTNNYLSVDKSDTTGWFGSSSGWSIELWFKMTSTSYTTSDAILGQYYNVVLMSGSGGTGVQFSGFANATTSYSLTSNTTLNDTNWHHLHIGYDGTRVRMFLDGALEDSLVTSVFSITTQGDFTIGARAGGFDNSITNYWGGYLADIHITSGSTTSVRTSAFDVDDVYAPELTDHTVLLVYGTENGIENETSITVTETGSNSAIGYNAAQPWAGWSVANITYDGRYTFTRSQITANGGGSSYYGLGGTARGVWFKPDGTRLYHIAGGSYPNTAMIYAMSLSTAWDVTSGTIDPDAYAANLNNDFKGFYSTSPTTYDTNLSTITWNSTGTRLWVFGSSYDTVIEYSLSTAWDITTMSVENKYISYAYTNETVASDWTNLHQSGSSMFSDNPYRNICGAEWSDDGTKLFVTRLGGDSYELHVYEYSTAYDLTTLTSTTISNGLYGVSSDANSDGIQDIHQSPYELAWASNGVLNHNGTSTLRVHQKFDTANYDGSLGGIGNGLNGWEVVIVKADLGSPYDPSTSYDYNGQAALTGLSGMNSYGYKPNGQIAFSPNGKKLYVMSSSQEDDTTTPTFAVYQYSIG